MREHRLPDLRPTASSTIPAGVAVDGAGNLYIADDGNDVIEKVTPDGQLSIIAGQVGEEGTPTPGAATDTPIGSVDVAADAAGDVFAADGNSNVVDKITPSGQLSIVAGVAGESGTPTAGPATQSDLNFGGCGQVAVDRSGNLYIADCEEPRFEEVTRPDSSPSLQGSQAKSGSPTPGPATSSDLNGPTGVAVDNSGNVLHRRLR